MEIHALTLIFTDLYLLSEKIIDARMAEPGRRVGFRIQSF